MSQNENSISKNVTIELNTFNLRENVKKQTYDDVYFTQRNVLLLL